MRPLKYTQDQENTRKPFTSQRKFLC
jgi:hypothetical protein